MDEKAFWLAMNQAIRRADEAFIRQAFGEHPEMIGYVRGDSWVHTAVAAHAQPMIRLLVELGCPLEVKDDLNVTPLGLASARDNPDTVRTLLELGADPNLPGTDYPLTALLLSSRSCTEIIKLLDQFGCDLHRVFDHVTGPTTALSLAIDTHCDAAAEFLRAKGYPLPPGYGEIPPKPPPAPGRPAADVVHGKWGAAVLRSIGPGSDVEFAAECQFGPPATAAQIAELEAALSGKLPKDLRELLTEFNGVKVGGDDHRETWFLSSDEIPAAGHFYDNWDSELVLKVFPRVAFICQKNGMSGLWGVVIRPFKPFKRGEIVAIDHDRIHEAETADELFTQPYGSLLELVEAKFKSCE